jgi:DNA-binding response OmpR family regulator
MKKTILMVTTDRSRFIPLAEMLKQTVPTDISWAGSGQDALSAAKSIKPLLAVVDDPLPDMSGLHFVQELMKINALISTAVVSLLPPEDFHEASEGLGVLVQLPAIPRREDGERILSGLRSIFALPPA